jgi:UDP-N-acetylglucosamine diphosphorylase/glucosamine-1-phosphate N-acetyltransferase
LHKLSELKFDELNLDAGSTLNIINYPWDLIRYHANALDKDFDALFRGSKKAAKKAEGCYFINPKDITISPKSIIMPGVVLNASKGRIYISGSAVIEPSAYIEGPAYIGEGSTVRSGASIYGPVSIRNYSKISGEINHSIIHSYVNKQHLGYLGHSYLCEWVNLGAGTTTSNLKNNYSPVSVELAGKPVDTGLTFLGSMVGDHTKTGINTMLNTGSLIGVSCNMFGSGYMPKSVRSFSWLDADRKDTSMYEIEKSLNTARTTMNRRKVEMTGAYEELFRSVYAESKEILI